MRYLIILIATLLFGANLINVNFFTEKNRVDILFSLDSKFNGKVTRDGKDFVITNIKANGLVQKSFENSFLNSVIITPLENSIKITILANEKYHTSVAITPDGFGVRFRIEGEVPQRVNKIVGNNLGSYDYTAYFIVLTILVILAILMFLLKKKMKNLPVNSQMNIIIQKPIDAKNRVVLFEFNNRKYLMLIGNTNILLDVFVDNRVVPKNETEFDEMLKVSGKEDEIKNYIKKAEKIDETI